jgi:hypothetical protein
MKNLKKKFILMTLVIIALQLVTLRISAFAYSAGDVVINEIAWAGTADGSSDEWIELYNTTNLAIDLSGWYIEDDAGASVYTIESGNIAPHSYFLIEDSEETISTISADAVLGLSLANAGDSLVLKDSESAVVDTVNGSGGAWYAGNSTTKASMERIDPNVSLDSADNWASALSSNGALGRSGSEILGTPSGANSNYGGAGPELSLIPSDPVVSTGDDLVVSVDIDGATDLYAYGFEINYDPAVLTYISVSEADFLKMDGESTAFNAALQDGVEGVLIVGNARLVNPPVGVDGSGELFDITFEVIGLNGASSDLTFGAGSFLSDSTGDIPAKFNSSQIEVQAGGAVDPVNSLLAAEGTDRYSLELTWNAGASGADSYIVKRQLVDGSYVVLGAVAEAVFVDNDSLVPGVTYNYQVIAVKNGMESLAVDVNGAESRGIKGDLDRTDRVDGRDIEKLARAYGSEYGDEEYDPLCDTNFDGIIDGSDLIDVGVSFGMSY